MYVRKQVSLLTGFFFPCWEYDNVIKLDLKMLACLCLLNYMPTFFAEVRGKKVVVEIES